MADAPSKVEEGVNIDSDGGVKIELKQAGATVGNGLNLVKVGGLPEVPDGLVLAITPLAWARINRAVERRLSEKPATP